MARTQVDSHLRTLMGMGMGVIPFKMEDISAPDILAMAIQLQQAAAVHLHHETPQTSPAPSKAQKIRWRIQLFASEHPFIFTLVACLATLLVSWLFASMWV